jgi:polyhydroxyalkanoate synthesis regulator phasin
MTHEPTANMNPGDKPQPSISGTRRLRLWLTGGTVALALGALLLGGTALAQDDATTGDSLRQAFIDKLAEKLGLTPDELKTTMREAGIEVVDDAVASGELTEQQGEALKARIESGHAFFHVGHGRACRVLLRYAVGLDTIATTLGMTTDELRAELETGTALTDIITAQGSTVAEVVDALVAKAQTALDGAVAAGRLTQAQADKILAELPERLTEKIESGFVGPWHHHWFNGDDASDGEDATPTI